jgi:hypothetical protein
MGEQASDSRQRHHGHVSTLTRICAGARSSTMCMSWLVLSQDKLSFRSLLDFLTDSLALLLTQVTQWEGKPERGANAREALDANPSLMALDNHAGDVEA